MNHSNKIPRFFLEMLFYVLHSTMLYCYAEDTITVKWTGIAGVLISDEATDIGIDITITRPELKHWLFNAPFLPNEIVLKKAIAKYQIKKIDALFISHTHCDHAVDIPWLSAEFSAPIYGSVSIHRLAKGYSNLTKKNVLLKNMVVNEPILIGKFKITPIHRVHGPILQALDWHFLIGDVPENTKLNFYDYYTGDTWSYLIEHPHGNIYLDQGARPNETILNSLPKIDVAILGTANKKSVEDWISGYGKKMHPKIVMPVHYDWFFLSWPDEPFVMPRMDLEELETELKKINIDFQKEVIRF